MTLPLDLKLPTQECPNFKLLSKELQYLIIWSLKGQIYATLLVCFKKS